MWTYEAILREAAGWAYVPESGVCVEDERRLLVHLPEHWNTSRVWRCSAKDEEQASALIAETVGEVRAAGRGKLIWHTGSHLTPPFMDACLEEHGFEETEKLEVLAFELGDSPEPGLPRFGVPVDIRAEPVLGGEGLWDVYQVASEVFSKPAPSKEEIAEYAAELEKLERRKRGEPLQSGSLRLMFTASIDAKSEGGDERRVIACAGEQIVGRAVRLWGAGTLARFRGRGAYRALVLERCRMGHALGATLAITRAKVGTAGPILSSAGFRSTGTERRYLLEVG